MASPRPNVVSQHLASPLSTTAQLEPGVSSKKAKRKHSNGKSNHEPTSDDSISAYINNTSSPHETSGSSGPSRRGTSDEGLGEQAGTPIAGAKTTVIRGIQEDDEEAASGMLSLRASQPETPRPVPALTWDEQDRIASRAPLSPTQGRLAVHEDSQDGGFEDAAARGLRLREGAQHDAVLFISQLSQVSAASSFTSRLQQQEATTSGVELDQLRDEEEDELDEDYTADTTAASSLPSQQHYDQSMDTSGNASQASSSVPLSQQQQLQEDSDQGNKKRRRRTKKEEAEVLASIYAQTAFPDSNMRAQLASQLGMTSRAVSIWFQNRRQAERKRASRFGTGGDTSMSSSGDARSVSMSSIPASTSAAANHLQRYPSLDAFVSQDSSSQDRRSPVSDDGLFLPIDLAASSSEQQVNATSEDKENVAPTSLPDSQEPSKSSDEAALCTRLPLKDIRDLVFGKETLSKAAVDETLSSANQANDDQPPLRPRTLARAQTVAAVETDSSTPSTRQPFGRSASVNGIHYHRKPSMDRVLKTQAMRPPRSPGLSRSLSTSQRGRASLDGRPSPSKKCALVRTLSQGKKLPPVLAQMLSDDEQEQQLQPNVEDQDRYCQYLLTKMRSSSSGESDAPVFSGEDVEDEERTLRIVANRRVARAQAKGQTALYAASDAMSDLISRPWARSISGPVGQHRPSSHVATLDLTASRDRSQPKPEDGQMRLPLAELNVVRKPLADVSVTKKAAKRKAISQGLVANKKKAADSDEVFSNASGTALSSARSSVGPTPQRPSSALARTPSTESPPSSQVSGLPTFTTPRNGLSALKRPFGRSVSAHYSGPAYPGMGDDLHHQTPLTRPLIPGQPSAMYSGTPALAKSQARHHPSSVIAPSAATDMTPRSLAFTLGLTNNSGYSMQTPLGCKNGMMMGGTGQTPFGTSSIFASRYQTSSSARDIKRTTPASHAVSYSPLAKARSSGGAGGLGEMLIGNNRDHHSSLNNNDGHDFTASRLTQPTPKRLPFSKVSSQPAVGTQQAPLGPPLAPTFVVPSVPRRQNSSDTAAGDKENVVPASMGTENGPRRSPRKSALSSITEKQSNGLKTYSGDDSGFVDMGTEEDEYDGEEIGSMLGHKRKRVATGSPTKMSTTTKVSGMGDSPTRVQQRRQEDAAQVLLGLAGPRD